MSVEQRIEYYEKLIGIFKEKMEECAKCEDVNGKRHYEKMMNSYIDLLKDTEETLEKQEG